MSCLPFEFDTEIHLGWHHWQWGVLLKKNQTKTNFLLKWDQIPKSSVITNWRTVCVCVCLGGGRGGSKYRTLCSWASKTLQHIINFQLSVETKGKDSHMLIMFGCPGPKSTFLFKILWSCCSVFLTCFTKIQIFRFYLCLFCAFMRGLVGIVIALQDSWRKVQFWCYFFSLFSFL